MRLRCGLLYARGAHLVGRQHAEKMDSPPLRGWSILCVITYCGTRRSARIWESSKWTCSSHDGHTQGLSGADSQRHGDRWTWFSCRKTKSIAPCHAPIPWARFKWNAAHRWLPCPGITLRSFATWSFKSAIIQPPPIVGNMMYPYMRRRQKKEAVTFAVDVTFASQALASESRWFRRDSCEKLATSLRLQRNRIRTNDAIIRCAVRAISRARAEQSAEGISKRRRDSSIVITSSMRIPSISQRRADATSTVRWA
jgi:hypothetical protein